MLRTRLLAATLGISTLAATSPVVAESITVYTAHAPEIYQAIVPQFEAATGIQVELVQAGSGDIVQRARAEANNPIADVIWSIGGEALEANSELLEHYEPADFDMINPLYLGGTNWLPYTAIPMAFIVNNDLVPEGEEPTSWQDLADPKWEGRIAFAGADGSGSAFIQMATVLHVYGEEEGWPLFEQMMENFIVTGSSGGVPRGTADGEYAVGLTLEEAAYRYVSGGAPVRIIYPTDGNYAGADAVALVKGGPNPDGGKAFIDFVLSAEIQSFLVDAMMRRPIRTDVADPEGLLPLSEMTIDNYDIAWAGENRERFIRQYLAILRR